MHTFSIFCKPFPKLCPTLLWPIMGGGNFSDVDTQTYYNSTRYDPSDTSVHNMLHWAQHFKEDRFGMFDYGSHGNQQHYQQPTPPDYPLNAISGVSIALFNGGKDDLSDPEDVARLVKEVPADSLAFQKTLAHYGHMDFIWGK